MSTSDFIDQLKKLSETKKTDMWDKFIFSSVINSTDLIFSPTPDEEYNKMHYLECLIFSSITHLLTIEAFDRTKFLKSKADLYKDLMKIITEFNPIPDYSEMEFGLVFFDRFSFIGQEISSMGNNEGSIPYQILSYLYDTPLLIDSSEEPLIIEENSTETKRIQLAKLNNYLSFLKTTLVPFIKTKK